MRIPHAALDRQVFLQQLTQKLTTSMGDRRERYNTLRSWYLYGGDQSRARYNKLYPHIGTLSALVYAQETTRFAVGLGPTAPQDGLDQAEAVSDRLRDVWHDSGADQLTASQVRWSFVNGMAIPKWQMQSKEVTVAAVHPGNFGVYREDIASLDAQEAVMEEFTIGQEAVTRILILGGMEGSKAEALVKSLGPTDADSGVPKNYVGELIIGQIQPISLTGPTGTTAGGISNLGSGSQMDYSPASEAPVLKGQELWIWDDEAKDYRLITLIEKQLILFDRTNIFVPRELPYWPIVPDPLDDYFWGYSQVDSLTPLQAWREKRMNGLDRLWQRQVNPPMVFTGFMGGVQDEKAAAVMRRGGILANSQQPGAKVELLTPTMPPETFGEITEIDRMFDETIGLSPGSRGIAQTGVKGGGHEAELMMGGSGRVIRRALNVEAALERAGSLLLKMLRVYDDGVLQTDDGQRFIMAQFTHDCSVKVAAHTSSPMFAGQAQQQALQLMELGIIDGQDYLELTDPPLSQVLKQRMKKREAAKQDEIQQMAQQIPPDQKAGFFASILGAGRKMMGRKR